MTQLGQAQPSLNGSTTNLNQQPAAEVAVKVAVRVSYQTILFESNFCLNRQLKFEKKNYILKGEAIEQSRKVTPTPAVRSNSVRVESNRNRKR